MPAPRPDSRGRPAIVIAAALLTLGTVADVAAAGDVLVVGASGSFVEVQDAVDAAQDGDIVLVGTGLYAPVTIVDKDVTVVADVGAEVELQGVDISSLSAGRAARVLGLHVNGTEGFPLPITSCLGSVRLEGCVVERLTLDVVACNDVLLRDVVRLPGTGIFEASGATALRVRASKAHLSGGEFQGSAGPIGGLAFFCPGDGGDGLFLWDSQLFASRTRFVGGNGRVGIGCDPIYSFLDAGAGSGGDAALVRPGSLFRWRGITLQPGAPGDGPECSCAADPGEAIRDLGGTIEALGGAARTIDAPRIVREDELFTVTLGAPAGEPVFVLWGTEPLQGWFDHAKGPLLVRPPFVVAFAGFAGPADQLTFVTAYPELGPGVDGRVHQAQVVGLDAQGLVRLGEGLTSVVVDRAL